MVFGPRATARRTTSFATVSSAPSMVGSDDTRTSVRRALKVNIFFWIFRDGFKKKRKKCIQFRAGARCFTVLVVGGNTVLYCTVVYCTV